jgi:predicted YcjX-like family ATPase
MLRSNRYALYVLDVMNISFFKENFTRLTRQVSYADKLVSSIRISPPTKKLKDPEVKLHNAI